jgi:predicted Zn-dependent peptidase
MVLAAAGAVDHGAFLAEAERRLAGFDPGPAPAPQRAVYSGGVRRSNEDFEQTHVVLAFEGPPYRHPDYFTAQICAGALGGGMSSRLFQEVREKRGLCYAIYAFASGLDDSGLFTIHAACASDRAHDLFAVIRAELVKAAEGGFRADEVARVKAQLKMGLLTGLESSGARSEQIARQILVYGRPLSTEELTERVDRVEAKDLQALIESMLASPVSLATVGPILHVARFDRVTEEFAVPSTRAA